MKSLRLLNRSLVASVLTVGVLQLPLAVEAETVMNIEIDYMDSTASGGHSHRPQAAEVAAVVQMFACRGITLNVVVDQAIPHSDVMVHDPGNANNFFGYSGKTNSFGYLRNKYFNHSGQSGWHYCIFGHQYQFNYATTTSSGLGEQPGGNFTVTLGAFAGQIGTAWDRAGSLAHEFGHNLGLAHGAVGNFQPNKPSVMSYFYQLNGVRTALLAKGLATSATSLFKELDYSDGTMCTLNESALDERFGSGIVSVDWDCNGAIAGTVSVGIDDAGSWCGSPGTDRNVLPDVNEWAIIHDTTKSLVANRTAPQLVPCITAEDAQRSQKAFPTKAQPAVTSEPCVTAKMVYLTPGTAPSGAGVGGNPFTTLNQAQAYATDGSHLFLLPGTFTADTAGIRLTKPMTLFCNIGTAKISPH